MNVLSHAVPKVLLGYLVLIFSDACSGLVLRALISQHGLHGEVEFSRKAEGVVAVRTALTPTLEHPEHALRWAVHTFPVDHRDVTDARCSRLGAVLHDLTDELGYLLVPGKDNAEFETKVPLTGPTGLWGRSLHLESAEGRVMCASILAVDEEAESYAEARFSSPVAGTVTFRWLIPRDASDPDADVTTDLYHMRAVRGADDYTQHKWKLFVTDIFDTSRSHDDSCDVLQAVFDPATGGDGLSVGDLDARLGLAHVARDGRVSARATYKHDVLRALRADMDATRRSLYVVVYDHQHEDSFLACGKLRLMPPQTAKVLINMAGVKGTISFRQPAPWAPTWASFELSPAAGDYEASLRLAGSVLRHTVRELPPEPAAPPERRCNTTGGVFNPSNVDLGKVPPPGMGTQDQYAVGDLLGKLLGRSPRLPHTYLLPGLAPELAGMYWDVFLPLRGAASVRHRALLLERRAPYPSVCGSVVPYESDTGYQTPVTTAEAVFRYPLVGRVMFRQPQDRPWEDTTIIIESLIHADGANVNDTFGHRWALHERAPGADWYNWSRRCESAGSEWEPRGLQVDPRQPDLYCGLAPLCRLGDLTTRHGMVSVAGRKRAAAKLTRRLFSDAVLSLSGRYSALKRSLIILDDHGPVARGERVACSLIVGSARRKAVVHDWFGEGAGAGLQGKLEVTQQSAYDIANLQLKLDNLEDVRDYQIHEAPVERELEFPCETSTLLEVYNPYNVSKSSSPQPTKGTVDEYAVGALGDKFGLLERQRRTHSANNDTVLSLFGERSVLGRSLLLARAKGTRRWACGTLQRGYSPSEARELRAIASFHHPGGFAWGYVRMTQLVSSDGGTSDTVLELKLRYPGDKDRNMTHGHRWEVWVNPVGVDAAVAVAGTRCVAGGYRWNPYFTQLADPLNVRERLASQAPEKREARLWNRRECYRNFVASQTQEQREESLAKLRQHFKDYVASQTPEQNEERLADLRQRSREFIASQTPEQREQRLADLRQRFGQYIASQTPEQREQRLADLRQRFGQYIASQTPEQREQRLADLRQRFGQYIASQTPEQREQRLADLRQRFGQYIASQTPEQREQRLADLRQRFGQYIASQTPEQREQRLADLRQRFGQYIASQTPEQREQRLADLRQRFGQYIASQTPEQREQRLADLRQRFGQYIASQTPEQREQRLADLRQRFGQYIASQTPEQREQRLADLRQRSGQYIGSQTPDQRESRLSMERERYHNRIMSETPDEREARLSMERERIRHRIASETPEQRDTRLLNLQQNSARWRTLLPQLRYIEEYEKAINVVCDRVCEICMKRCYPSQIHTVQYRPAALSYLPTELSQKTLLLLCSRCQSHVTSNKTTSPAKAFWNNLDPGPVPEVLQALTQAEQRLLCRVIPFVKIVKFSGLFGQYGFRGQAVLFAQDIFEVSEQLPTMLPKSSSQAGIVILTEHLENLNITREYTISRDKVYAALRWLVANNPLYRDVQVDETAQINEQDIIRVTGTPRTSEPHEEVNAFVPINDVAKIIRASWHQGDASIFTTGYAGMQCSAMSMANILRAKILDPSQWSANILNSNMLEGDALYCKIRALLQPHEIDEAGHLEIRNFHVVRNSICMYDALFIVDYEDDTSLFGSLQDNINVNSIGITLMEALTQLFDRHISGILTASQKSVSVMYSGHIYYFTDSHSCGPKGKPVAGNGKACVIQCETIQELCRICKRCLGSRNIPYTLTYVDVHCTQEAMQRLLSEPLQALSPLPPPPVSELSIAVQTSVMLPVDSAQPDVEDELEVSERVNEIRRKTNDNIVNEAHELKAEEFAWYQLFPLGKNGLKEARPVNITPLDYYQFRILGEDSRFQRNDYLFYALSMFEYYQVKSTIAACARKVEGEHGTKVEDLHLYLKNLRGSAAYWRSALSDLIAQIRCLGPPNYFLTLSCNDLYWTDMRKVLLMADGRDNVNPEELDVNTTQRLIEMYPVAVSRHFMVRVNALMRFLKLDASIFGSTIKDFWWRIEFQNRGSPHLHMVVWVEDHPPIDTPEGIARIDDVCKTSSAPEDTELRSLIQKCQLHHHTVTCTKNSSTNTCRFNFPHNECSETHIIDPSSDDFLRSGGRICVLKRELVDRWVNNYNPNLLKMWKANMDIQPCGTNESIAYYIAKYVAKSEPTNLDEMK